MAGRKIFVGSLPHQIPESALHAEFDKFGTIEDVFVKTPCEATRQWAFITFATADAAQRAKDATDRVLQFPGIDRPCDVMIAKNQGMFGQNEHGAPNNHRASPYGLAPPPMAIMPVSEGIAHPKKIFVGSLPQYITDADLRAEFSNYGHIQDVHLNTKQVEPGRQWAFITFASPDQAQQAKVSCDRTLMFPGSEKPCEVTLARHQGMFGKDSLEAPTPQALMEGPKKIFVGSLPSDITPENLRFEFSRYGQVVDVHVNTKSVEPGRQWAFVTFATAEQASYAKDSTDRVLTLPGAEKACEVMLAKNQGKFGEGTLTAGAPAPGRGFGAPAPAYGGGAPGYHVPMGAQPPPPQAPPPPHLTPWRQYKTAAGLPYYHNHQSGVTQWECPPDLQVPGQTSAYVVPPPRNYRPY